jgi:hypothetical protein
LAGDWRRLDQRIDGLSGEIEALALQDQACSRLMTGVDNARNQRRKCPLGNGRTSSNINKLKSVAVLAV